MAEPVFTALRDLLEAQARQPGFDTIQARHRRHLRSRAAIAAVTVLTLVLAVGTIWALEGNLRPAPRPPALPAPSFDGPVADIVGLTASPDGVLYAQVTSCSFGDGACGQGSQSPFPGSAPPKTSPTRNQYGLLVSHDLGATWTRLGVTPPGGRLLDTGPVLVDDNRIWITGQVHSLDPTTNRGNWTGALSVDKGRSWRTWSHEEPITSNTLLIGAIAAGTVWFAFGRHVYIAQGEAQPTLTPAQPEGLNNIFQLTPLGPRHALLMGSANSQSPGQWLETVDAGRQWTPAPDPCANTPVARTPFAVVTVAPNGTLWAICSPIPAAPPTGPADLVRTRYVMVSTDQGRSWQQRGTFTEPVAGLLTLLRPVSTTIAWRYTVSGDLMRTTDGHTWTVVDHLPPSDWITGLAVVDAMTAVSVVTTFPSITATGSASARAVRLRVTRDGGNTWTEHHLP